MIIAIATTEGIEIDTHFGWAKRFDFYELSSEIIQFIKSIDTSCLEEEHEALNQRIAMIQEAQVLYCTKIGPSAAQMVRTAGIYPLLGEGTVKEALHALQQKLHDSPPPWLLRLMMKGA